MEDYNSQYNGSQVDAAIAKANSALQDAPSDGKQYARKNGAWSEVEAGEPSAYIKSAAVSQDGNTLTLTKKDDTTVEFAPKSQTPIANTIPSGGMLPDVFYALGVIAADPNITLAANPTDGKDHEYMLSFSIGATAPSTITFPISVKFPSTPSWEANKHYEVSMKWDATDEVYYAVVQSW